MSEFFVMVWFDYEFFLFFFSFICSALHGCGNHALDTATVKLETEIYPISVDFPLPCWFGRKWISSSCPGLGSFSCNQEVACLWSWSCYLFRLVRILVHCVLVLHPSISIFASFLVFRFQSLFLFRDLRCLVVFTQIDWWGEDVSVSLLFFTPCCWKKQIYKLLCDFSLHTRAAAVDTFLIFFKLERINDNEGTY